MNSVKHITIPQLAAKLGLSRIAVYRKVKLGQIRAEKVGRAYIIPVQEAEAVLSGRPTANDKKLLRKTVRRVVREYGVVLERLSKC